MTVLSNLFQYFWVICANPLVAYDNTISGVVFIANENRVTYKAAEKNWITKPVLMKDSY